MRYPPAANKPPGPALVAGALVLALLCGALSVWLGQDANWDLRNYHYYNAYAFLNGRLGFDVAPAHHATYYNPLPDLPFYWLVNALPPRGAGFALGAFQGLNAVPVMAIAWAVLRLPSYGARAAAAIALAAAGMLGAGAVSELGATFHDNTLGLLVLTALAMLVLNLGKLAEGPARPALWLSAAAGLVAGAGVGLKQPLAIFAVGICVALFFVGGPFRRRFACSFVFGLGVLAGIAATGGFWMWTLWRHYGNPLFPYYNDVFRSPWAAPEDYVNRLYLPQGWSDALLFPFRFTAVPSRTAEVDFTDLRIPVLYALAFIALIAAPLRLLGGASRAEEAVDGKRAAFVLIAAAVAYALWLFMFAIYRYLVPLEMLAPVLIAILVEWLALPRWVKNFVFGGIVGAVAATWQPADWGRAGWAHDYFGVEAPKMRDPAAAMAIMAGTEPIAYAIPFFPKEVPFLRIEGWFTGPSPRPNETDRAMRRRIEAHGGDLYAFFRARYERDRTIKALAAYGLALREAECITFKPHIDIVKNEALAFCPLDRRKAAE